MIYTNSENLMNEYRKLLIDNKLKHGDIASKLDMSKQNFSKYLKKDKPTFSDIQRLLDIIGYDLQIDFVKRDN